MRRPPFPPNPAAVLIAREMRAEGIVLLPETVALLSQAMRGSVAPRVLAQDPEIVSPPCIIADHGTGEVGLWRASVEQALGSARQVEYWDPGEAPRCQAGHRYPLDASSSSWVWLRCRKAGCDRFTLVLAGDVGQSVSTDLTMEEAFFLAGRGLSLRDVVRFLQTARQLDRARWSEKFPASRGEFSAALLGDVG